MKYTFELDFHGSKVMKRDESGQITTYVHDDEFVRVDFHEAALTAKDRELADANHMLILANNNANAFRRMAEQRQAVIEQLQRAVEWLLDSTVTRNSEGQLVNWCGPGRVEIPAEFAEIIRPGSGESNG